MNVLRNNVWVDGIPWVLKSGIWVKGISCHVAKNNAWVNGDCIDTIPAEIVSNKCKETYIYYVEIEFNDVPVVLDSGKIDFKIFNGTHDLAVFTVNGNTLEGRINTADTGTLGYANLSILPGGLTVGGTEFTVTDFPMTMVAAINP